MTIQKALAFHQREISSAICRMARYNMSKIIDQIFQWKGHGDPQNFARWNSFCRLRIYQNASGAVIVASDISDRAQYTHGTGTSITSSAENLARIVVAQFELDPLRFTFIEHYPAKSGDSEFARVEFEHAPDDERVFQHPHWSPMTEAEARRLTGDDEL